MGIEGDRLILDYLSKVGDLAQTAMPARERAQLVAKLRDDIDRQRRGRDNPAAVRKILGRLGSPDEVVSAAGRVPAQREPQPAPRPGPKAVPAPPHTVPEPSGAAAAHPAAPEPGEPGGQADPGDPTGPGVPAEQAGGPADPADPVNLEKPQAQPLEWWRTQPQRRLTLEEIAALPGVTIPLDKPGPSDEEAQQDQAPDGQSPKDGDGASPDDSAASKDAEKSQARRGWLRRAAPASRRVRRRSVLGGLGGAVIEMLAALALLSGAVLGSWWALLIGWAMAYYSRRLSPSEAKFASLGLPGTVLVGTLVWLWGRIEGRWGEPLAQGQLRAAISDAFPWMVRIAAVGSALFILWRSRTRTAD